MSNPTAATVLQRNLTRQLAVIRGGVQVLDGLVRHHADRLIANDSIGEALAELERLAAALADLLQKLRRAAGLAGEDDAPR